MDPKAADLLEKGVTRIIDRKSLEEKLASGRKLRVKFGVDPSGSVVHIGHAVPILKLRQFQELGHHVILLIGDATAQVGDSSDKNAERPMLKREETTKNAEAFLAQFAKVVDVSKVEIYYNSAALDRVNFCGVGELAKHFSVAEMLDRDNFSKRYKAGVRISLQEFLYPLMQGYDSVALKADVELGGNDQYFNLLAGRRLQEAFGQPKQDIMTFDLLEGLDGKKMSKTAGNHIALSDAPNDMFAKVMSIRDGLIVRYFTLCTRRTLAEIAPVEKMLAAGEHPRAVKLELAREITALYHGEDAAKRAQDYFESVISGGGRPADADIPTHVSAQAEVPLVTLLRESGLAGNSTEARNAIEGGGVLLDGAEVRDLKHVVKLEAGKKVLVQMGRKKFRNVTVRS